MVTWRWRGGVVVYWVEGGGMRERLVLCFYVNLQRGGRPKEFLPAISNREQTQSAVIP